MWRVAAVPIVGAIIGYATNWIAVKMLFRPRYEKYFMGAKVPFTPGVIPRGKARLAKAVGRAVQDQLLTKDILEGVLLSDEIKEKLRLAVNRWVEEQKASEDKVYEKALTFMTEEKYEESVSSIKEEITDYAYREILAMNPGKLLTEKLLGVVSQKLSDSFLGMMLGGSFLESIGGYVEQGINDYLEEEGRSAINGVVLTQVDKLEMMPVGQLIGMLEDHHVDLASIVLAAYEYMIREKMTDMFAALNLSAIVEERINAMEVEEVEELMLSIMKKELGAIVNLGAVIGFLLGLVNVAILLI